MMARAFRITVLAAGLCVPMAAAVPDIGGQSGATVLCYHIVESPLDPRMEISRETFLQQMRYLAMTDYTVIPLRDAYEYAVGKRATLPRNPVVVTIDDGWRSTYTEVYPEMKRLHFPFTVFIYPRIIGMTPYALTWKQVKQMADAGVDIQSHSLSHPFLTRRRNLSLDDKRYATWLDHELSESKRTLEHVTGKKVTFLAYPYGDYDHRLIPNVARAGYEAALTCDFGRVQHNSDPLRMKRVVIDKKMDFATFRHYLGARSMKIEEMPPPGDILDGEPVVVAARIPDHETVDPTSVGMALLSVAGTIPYSYDPHSGSVSVTVRETLRGTLQRALVWATDSKTGRRLEAIWTFRLPAGQAGGAAESCPAIDVVPPLQTAGGSVHANGGIGQPQRKPGS